MSTDGQIAHDEQHEFINLVRFVAFRLAPLPAEAMHEKIEPRVRAMFDDGNPHSLGELVSACDRSAPQIAHVLKKLVGASVVERIAMGVYRRVER